MAEIPSWYLKIQTMNLDGERCHSINMEDVLKLRDLSFWPYLSDAEKQSHSPETLGGPGGPLLKKKTFTGSWPEDSLLSGYVAKRMPRKSERQRSII